MRISVFSAALALLTPHSMNPAADVSLTIVEYRVLQSVGQVRLTSGYVHDPETQKSMLADLMASDRRGVILVAGDSVRQFKRGETIGAHRIETTLTVYPAFGYGYHGGLATVDVIVTIDGRKVVDCPFDRGPTELHEIDILARDGLISILGTHGGKPVQAIVSLKDVQTIDAEWLARNAK